MPASHPRGGFSLTNELAKERNRAAAERTLNAWVGNCLSLIGLGVAVDQISRSLQQRFPHSGAVTAQTAHLTGMVLIGISLILLVMALIQHHLAVKSIEQADYLLRSVNALNRVVMAGILLLGLAGIFTIMFLL